MNKFEYSTAIWNAVLRGCQTREGAERIACAVDRMFAVFPHSEIESYEGPEPDYEEPPPPKQRDFFDHTNDLDYLWDRFQERMHDPDS